MKVSRILRAAGIAVAIAVVGVGASQARTGGHQPNGQIPKTFVLPGDALFPEGMGYDAGNGDYFVGAIGGGAVLRGDVHDPTATVFSPAGADGRTAALGARPDHGRVFVGSFGSGKVWIYGERNAQADRDARHGAAELGAERLLLPARRDGVRDRLDEPVPVADHVLAQRQADAREVPRLHRDAVRLRGRTSTRTGSSRRRTVATSSSTS